MQVFKWSYMFQKIYHYLNYELITVTVQAHWAFRRFLVNFATIYIAFMSLIDTWEILIKFQRAHS